MKIINKAITLVGKMLKGLTKWFKDAGMELIAKHSPSWASLSHG
jgi:hypothetical protein